MMKTREREGFLYEQIAFEIAALIEKGTYRPGTRIPSVREMSRQRNASVSTILEAYRLLENRGQIEVRPQSGYYVSPGSREGLPTPEERPEHVLDPMKVTVEELTMKVFKDTSIRGLSSSARRSPIPRSFRQRGSGGSSPGTPDETTSGRTSAESARVARSCGYR
jgi:DNA-binding transcriptional regulator YhcF (GntR family)